MGAQPAGDDRAKDKGLRETWRDWLPPERHDPGQLLTREQLVKRLQAAGVKADVADLRYWEYLGILPRAVRQRHEGATRAVYPEWFVYLVRQLRALQGAGYDLDTIGSILRVIATSADDGGFGPEMVTMRVMEQAGGGTGMAVSPPELETALRVLAERIWHAYGPGAVRRGEVRFYGDNPEPIVYPFTVTIDETDEGNVSET